MDENLEILVVEDNKADRLYLREILVETGVPVQIHEVTNGADALAWMRREGRFALAPKPDVIILDLNLPRLDGNEFIAQAGSLLEGVEIIVMSGSPEVTRTKPAASYLKMVKPSTGEEFDSAVATLRDVMQGRRQ